jgi:ribosomal protein S14
LKRKNKFFFQNKRFLLFQNVELSKLYSFSEKHYSVFSFISLSKKKNRCFLTGATSSHLCKFGLSRQAFREKALLGILPGIRKSSF